MPIGKDAYYFLHFSNARNDRKVKRLRKDLHTEGYAIYMMLLEVLRDQPDFSYPLSDLDLLADDFGTSEAKVKTVISKYELFQIDGNNRFFSPKLIEYLLPYLQKVQRAKDAANKRWSDYQEVKNANAYANALQMESKCNASQNAIREDKIREEKNKENIGGDNPPDSTLPPPVHKKPKKPSGSSRKFVAPTVEEVQSFFSEKGFPKELAIKAHEYYSLNDWRDSSGKPVLSWKQKMLSTWMREENRSRPEQKQSIVNTLSHLPNAKTIVDKYR